MKINASTRLRAAMPLRPVHLRRKTVFGPAAMTVDQAKAKGYTDGPYYHGTEDRSAYRNIMQKGFRSKGAKGWEIEDPGTVEEFVKWGTTDPVMFTPQRSDAAAFGKNVVTCYVKPGKAFSANGMTFYGGLYVKHPADIVPIIPEGVK